MKSLLDEELESLYSSLIKMGLLIETAIRAAVVAFTHKDMQAANSTIQMEEDINSKCKELEEFAIKLLLRYQPVAKDLRKISSALRMVNDLKRIGNQASDIASLVIHLCDKNEDYILDNLVQMANKAIVMVKGSLDAFATQDSTLARRVIAKDDEVDELFLQIRTNIVELIQRAPRMGESEIDLLMISKYLEKIADHAVSIATWVIYSITGEKEAKG